MKVIRTLRKRMTVENTLPRLFASLGCISLIVYVSLGRNGSRFTYSHPSYVVFGISIGFEASAILSMIVIRLLNGKKQEPNR